MSRVDLSGVTKLYGETRAVESVTLTVNEGEFFGLLGPSGSGKSTLLRLVAGFIQPTQGTIHIGGERVEHIPPSRRQIGMVFQSYALFPHLDVFRNVAFGLEVRRVPRADIARRVADVLALVQLVGLEHRRPSQLSGGQQQRVALARALVIRPKVLLLDEPLGALDRRLRAEMQVELRQIQRRVGITTIFVTHDQEEALTLSDRVALMRAGASFRPAPHRKCMITPSQHLPRSSWATRIFCLERAWRPHSCGSTSVRRSPSRRAGTEPASGSR